MPSLVSFRAAALGSPQALWENTGKRGAIQAVLDGGDIDVFGMTYHPDYPTIEGYRNWVNYALQKNTDTRFFIALPWATSPASSSSASYEAFWHLYHPLVAHAFIDTLRAENPGVDLSTYQHDAGYSVDLKAIAQQIMEDHDPAYNAPQ